MVNRQYVWTEEGLRRSTANGIDFAEVASALYAPTGLRYERTYGDLLVVVMGMASTGRVVAVVCDRIGGQDVVFKIIGARLMTTNELDDWRRRLI